MKDLSARPRLLPERPFPAYAYLPGRQPHPVRDPGGHSYRAEAAQDAHEGAHDKSDLLYWGMDLFNHGYYWEAHEAWEELWLEADNGSARRRAYKGLILLAAAGVKIREGKIAAAQKHARRAATHLRAAADDPDRFLSAALGYRFDRLSDEVERISESFPVVPISNDPEPVFFFMLGRRG